MAFSSSGRALDALAGGLLAEDDVTAFGAQRAKLALKRSSPTPTDQPSLVGSTTNIVIVCLAMHELAKHRARPANP
jgi:hypothetical protein